MALKPYPLSNRRKPCNVFQIIVACLVLALPCCNNQSQNREPTPINKVCILIARSLQETVELVPATTMNEYFFKQYGVPADLQSLFTTTYEKLRSDLQHVQEKYAFRESVRYFLLNRYLLDAEDTSAAPPQPSKLASASNPVFMAFSLQAEQMPVFENIGNPTYVKTLARSFGVTERQVVEGIWLLLKNDPKKIYEAVALMIKVNATNPGSFEPDFLFRNAVIPYLTYISKGLPLHDSVENSVCRVFKSTFEPQASENALQNFVVAFKDYLSGNSLHVNYMNALNNVIGAHDFRLYVDDRSTLGYHIFDKRLPVNRDSIGDVIFLKKISICLSMPFLGLSTANERDVIIAVDDISEYADDIMYALNNGKPFVSFASTAAGYWSSLATGFDLETADDICVSLMKQDFKKQSRRQITQKLIHGVALHEVKHKWDETTKVDKGWYVVDCEVSAHFAETIFGPTPRYSLVSQLHRFQKFYEKSSMIKVREKMQPLLQQLWKNAQQLSTSAITVDVFRKQMTALYASYSTLESGTLPPLETFNREIVTPCFDKLPDFSTIEEMK